MDEHGSGGTERTLKIVIVLTSAFFVAELLGGLLSGSLSLLGDAGHMLRDVFALTVSLGAIIIARRFPTSQRTFGYHRVEILAAFLNGIALMVISFWIFWESYLRFLDPQPVQSGIMFVVAAAGLLVNVYAARRLHGSHDINVRSAFVHVLTDLLSSVAVVLAAILIFFTGMTIIDPILGAVIAAFVLLSAVGIIKESVRILLDFAPKDVDFDRMVADMEGVGGVQAVNNVHLWALCSNVNIIDAHILTKERDMGKIERTKAEIKRRLEKYNVKHATLEFECRECAECRECNSNHSKVKRIED